MSEAAPKSVLALRERTPLPPALVLAIFFHLVIFAAAFYLPRLLDRPPPMRKPIIAKLVALGKPRDKSLLPRKESPPPAAAAAPVAAPGGKAAPSTAHVPTRRELMERALAHAAGNANLATVARPISEALIATAMGLFAAIPALVAYNAFNSRIRVLDNEMRNFSADFLNIIKRHIFKKAA